MALTAGMTKPQKRRAYREAVQASLIEFYQTPETESKRLVTAWWKRLSDTSGFKSGLFMHAEPINAAADLIDVEVIPITSEIRERYRRILRDSRSRVLRGRPGHETAKTVDLQRPAFEQTAQITQKKSLRAAEKKGIEVQKPLTVAVRS
jgi:hypothetical protein